MYHIISKLYQNIVRKLLLILFYLYNQDNSTCLVACQYYSIKQSKVILTKYTKELSVNSDNIEFENELIKFDNINIKDGIIYFFFVINGVALQETNTDVPTYNRLILDELGIRPTPVKLSFFVGNYTTFNITIKMDKMEVKEIKDKKGNYETNIPSLNNSFLLKDMISSSEIDTPQNKKKSNLRGRKDNKKLDDESQLRFSVQVTPLYEKKEKNLKDNDDEDTESRREKSFNFLKKKSVPVIEQHIEQNEIETKDLEIDTNEYYLKGTRYDTYLSQLSSSNKKEHQTGRETFCEGFFIASFPRKNGQVIENSQSFPAPCGHKECSSLPAMQPEIIARYPLKDTKTLELNNLAATICFPTGIKVCYSEKNPLMINDYVTPITTPTADRYYMVTFHFYYRIDNGVYSNIYEMHPLKNRLMKFGDSYLNLSDGEMNKNIMNEIQKSLEKSQELGFRDYVYIPYCICLISKYPYVSEMKKCLQSIYLMIINNLEDDNLDLNNLIMYLIHSVPIPERETIVRFCIPYYKNNIKLICPKMQDINIMNTNISNLLKLFSIDHLIIILRLMLFEKRILFIDNDYTRLSLVTDNFISLLYPFQWVHAYIPIMSDQMIHILETFLPFINGINSSLMPLVADIFKESLNEDEVFLIYIDQNKYKLGSSLINSKNKKNKYIQDNVPSLPTQIEKELKNKLKKIKEELDSYLKNQKNKKTDLTEFDLRIRNAFIEIFVQMFHDYYKYMTFLDEDVVFNKSLFLEKITNANDKRFYTEFIDTQLFQQFCQNIVKDELKYFTTMVMNYDPNKSNKENLALKRALTNIVKLDKLYIIRPEYLKIIDENMEVIEKKMQEKYILKEEVDEDGMMISEKRIIFKLNKIKDDKYNNKNCYIYIIPESQISKKEKKDKNDELNFSSESIIFKAIQSLRLKTNKKFNTKKGENGISEKEKDAIKETIKDFTMDIFTSKDIKDDQNKKKDLQNALNTPFGRKFFVGILSKNFINIILLKEKPFDLLGTLIYNSLLYILNIKETNNLLEEMVILVKSTKYFGKEINGKTTTLWVEYKPKIQGYSKVKQNNFWERWYKMEIEQNDKLSKEDEILNILDIMIELELDKSFIKNLIIGLAEKNFGKNSDKITSINEIILKKIKNAVYHSKQTII